MKKKLTETLYGTVGKRPGKHVPGGEKLIDLTAGVRSREPGSTLRGNKVSPREAHRRLVEWTKLALRVIANVDKPLDLDGQERLAHAYDLACHRHEDAREALGGPRPEPTNPVTGKPWIDHPALAVAWRVLHERLVNAGRLAAIRPEDLPDEDTERS